MADLINPLQANFVLSIVELKMLSVISSRKWKTTLYKSVHNAKL